MTKKDGTHSLDVKVQLDAQLSIKYGGWIIGNSQGFQSDIYRCTWKPEKINGYCDSLIANQKIDNLFNRDETSEIFIAKDLWTQGKSKLRKNGMQLQAKRQYE
jgi:hypothetical protein